jgi:DNA-binding CsgD family transcriptional regulator
MDADTLRLEAIEVLHGSLGFAMWGIPLVDPDTMIPYRPLVSDPAPWGARLAERWMLDQSSREINDRCGLARAQDHVGVLSVSMGGDLARCRRWRELGRPTGMGDELRAAIVDGYGCWGSFELFRGSDDPSFEDGDAELMRGAARMLAPALRQTSVSNRGSPPTAPRDAGVLVIADDLRPIARTGSATAWLGLMSAPTRAEMTEFPMVVYETIGRLIATEAGEDAKRAPRVRAQTSTGDWAVVEASRLDIERAIAVTMRRAAPFEVLDLLARAHGLTARERQLVELVVTGLDTKQLAARLCISAHTAKDHLKSVFGKLGIHSRRELLVGLLGAAGDDEA